MARPWLVLDTNYLCYRAAYSTGSLSHEGVATGVSYGVFREIVSLQARFQTTKFAFAFDYGTSLRQASYPNYKAGRHAIKNDEQLAIQDEITTQIKLLRDEYLPEIGFRNIFFQDGYEADDIIASICFNLNEKQNAIMVSSDHDLFQLLGDKVRMWLPTKKELIDVKKFVDEYKVLPWDWIYVKAIAGCSSDKIEGVSKVGEKTAIKYLNGQLKPTTKAFKSIKNSQGIIDTNVPLVTLPYPGTPICKLHKHPIEKKGWNNVMRQLGIRTLCNEFPGIE